MKRRFKAIVVSTMALLFLANAPKVSAQFINPGDAAVLAKLGEILRTHRQSLIEAIRTARGMERTFQTLKDLDDYEKNLRRDVSFVKTLDMTRLNDLERLILYGDQSNFYFRSLTGKVNRDLYNMRELNRYGDGFFGSLEGLGVTDENLLQALFADDKSLSELGISQQQAGALLKELSVESTMMDMYQVKGTEDLIKALLAQANHLRETASDSSIKMDPGQRALMLAESEKTMLEALKQQQILASLLKDRNEKMSRRLLRKSQLENEIDQLRGFYEWHSSLERNLGFFDTDYIKREKF